MASVRLLHQRASLTSVEGGRRVFIIGDAERLVPQESSQEAANALLKLLEEPPPRSLFVLTRAGSAAAAADDPVAGGAGAAQPAEGRAGAGVPRRAGTARQLSAQALEERVALAGGSIGDALAADEDSGKAYRAAGQLLEAVLAGIGRRATSGP